MKMGFFISFVITFFLIGCDPIPIPNPDPSNDSVVVVDTTTIDSSWEIMERNENGLPCFFLKEDGDSVTTVWIVECFIDLNAPFAIQSDIRVEGRRMISIASLYMISADSARFFNYDLIPDQIDFDKYSPNK